MFEIISGVTIGRIFRLIVKIQKESMKKILSLLTLVIAISVGAQTKANRFFYELTFKPKTDSAKIDKVITILDIVDEKSIYQDYTMVSQDSILKENIEEMMKTKTFKDIASIVRMPKFSFKVYKKYPDMNVQYIDRISTGLFGYEESPKFNWQISEEKQKIGDYTGQKATTTFGGREWTAWFSLDIPFPDGPYKFNGLPGIIVKIEDKDKEYSWVLSGNKTIEDWKEFSYGEEINAKMGMMKNDIKIISKDKFDKAFASYKQDPFAEVRSHIPPNAMSMKMPGSDMTIGDMLKRQEKVVKDFFNSVNNPIERTTTSKK